MINYSKFLVALLALAIISCQKDQSVVESHPGVKKSEPSSAAVELPEDEEEVIIIVENFYEAYEDYLAESYDEETAPEYQVGYALALLEATFNAYHATEAEEYYIDYIEEDEQEYSLIADFTGEDDIPVVSEYDLILQFDELMSDFGSYGDLMPVSDIVMSAEVGLDGSFDFLFRPAKQVNLLQDPIGPGEEYKAYYDTECNSTTPSISSWERLTQSNYMSLALPWYYNVKTYYCHDKNNEIIHGGWDFDVYYMGIDNLGKQWPYVAHQDLQDYESLFLGGEFFTNKTGATAWLANDCVSNSDLIYFDSGVKTVISDFKDKVRTTMAYLKMTARNPYTYTTPLYSVHHGLEFVSPTGAILTPELGG